MRLSEAIRLGAMAGRQLVGQTFGRDHSSCALGSALIAINRVDVSKGYSDVFNYFPLASMFVTWPNGGPRMCVLSHIRHMNDDDGWTREQIADWVEGVERELTPEAFPLADAVARTVADDSQAVPARIQR